VAALGADDLDPATGLQWFEMGVAATGSLWDDQGFIDLTGRWVNAARTLGALTELPVALAWQAFSAAVAGRLQDANTRSAELRELIKVNPGPGLLGIDSLSEGLLLAYRGQLAAARASGLAQIRESTVRGQHKLAEFGQYIVAVADLCAGDYDAAAAAALTVIEDDTPGTAEWALPELIEAAARAGHGDVARSAFETMSERALAAGSAWALGLRARCAALIDDGERAEEHYQEAVSQLQLCRAVVDLARTHLLFGQWLRRARRRRDARRELRTAWEMFSAMGAEGFAEQAATELRATGERTRARSPESSFDLTPREAGVADLAAAGASNTDIAAQLFISPSTVEHHLASVFRKLGITSRTQLARLRPVNA
jgi:DNA-binding CsgD family transcriptional regulator